MNKLRLSSIECSVLLEAYLWWSSRRPEGWSEARHIAEPTVNTFSHREEALAREVAHMAQALGKT